MKSYDELKALITQRGVHAVFGDYGEGYGIEQNADELAHFLVHMQELGVTSVLEVGTGYKAGLARFLHDDLGWTVTSVDIHDYGHQYGGITFETSDGVELPVFQQQFDLVLLDGDHSYEGVKVDHDYYGKYAAKVIAFHDIAGLRDCEDVAEYWFTHAYEGVVVEDTSRLKPGYYELIAEGDQRGGIGYIGLSETSAEPEPSEAPVAAKKPATRKSASKKPAAKK